MATPSLASSTFALLQLFTGYLGYRNLNPPNPIDLTSARDPAHRDTIASPASFFLLSCFRNTVFATSLWQSLVCLSPDPNASPLLPRGHALLDPRLLSWTPVSVPILAIIWIGGVLRLRAMGELGANFTFDLKEPAKLETGGIYSYVQHPSYSAGIFNMAGTAAWFLRCDGIWSTVMPEWAQKWRHAGNGSLCLVAVLVMGWALYVRVRDEEEMLRRRFGTEWEAWHESTPRFVPFAPIIFRKKSAKARE